MKPIMFTTRRPTPESPTNVGRSGIMNTTTAPGGFRTQATQLLSARVDAPRQWVVTLSQATRGNGVSPWNAPTEGQAVPSPVLTGFDAPDIVGEKLQCELRWAAGAASFVTRFDYPIAGTTFGVTAESLDLTVSEVGFALGAYANLGLVPVVGASMCRGVPSGQALPLRWLENIRALGDGDDSTWWSVKPYARQVRIGALAAPVRYSLTAVGAILPYWVYTVPADTTLTVDVPPRATYMRADQVTAGDAPVTLVEWLIGLT